MLKYLEQTIGLSKNKQKFACDKQLDYHFLQHKIRLKYLWHKNSW